MYVASHSVHLPNARCSVRSEIWTVDRTLLDREHFEKLKSAEQELSNQKLLGKFTKLRLEKKESECVELQKSMKSTRAKHHELMAEIASISKKNTDLMTYCESKVVQCRAEYDKMAATTFTVSQSKKRLEEEVAGLRLQSLIWSLI